MLAESLLIAAAGAASGAMLAHGSAASWSASSPATNAPIFVDLAIAWRIFAFTVGVGV
jgi:hypothetical protein